MVMNRMDNALKAPEGDWSSEMARDLLRPISALSMAGEEDCGNRAPGGSVTSMAIMNNYCFPPPHIRVLYLVQAAGCNDASDRQNDQVTNLLSPVHRW